MRALIRVNPSNLHGRGNYYTILKLIFLGNVAVTPTFLAIESVQMQYERRNIPLYTMC